MVTENGMVMMTLGEYHSLNATKNKVKEIEKSNETEIYLDTEKKETRTTCG